MRVLVLVMVLLAAAGAALAQGDAGASAGTSAAADAGAEPDASGDAAEVDASAPPRATAFTRTKPLEAEGTAPLPGDARVPLALLPPGAFADDRGPSPAIFPPQKLTLRFDHKLHAGGLGVACTTCHPGAKTSHASSDSLVPTAATCDGCHGTSHADPNHVRPGTDEDGKCDTCHLGYREGDGNKVARFEIPKPNMRFDHQKHFARNINCRQCHGEVQELALATRDQLPRMRGCITCHQHPDAAARGTAKGDCETCHLPGGANEGGRIRTVFASGTLMPPGWLRNASHGPDFVQRHKLVAANDSQFCASCHKEESCTACHDGRVRPRNIHPSDYLSMHAAEARLATQRCTSCHREQSFCLTCHQRLGVAQSGPPGARDSGRFHPPAAIWSDAPRKAGHHAFEAMRNLNACVSCHIERDCVVCHGGRGIGAGFDPHPNGFAASCASQLRRNPRPCLVCHDPGSSAIARCR